MPCGVMPAPTCLAPLAALPAGKSQALAFLGVSMLWQRQADEDMGQPPHLSGPPAAPPAPEW